MNLLATLLIILASTPVTADRPPPGKTSTGSRAVSRFDSEWQSAPPLPYALAHHMFVSLPDSDGVSLFLFGGKRTAQGAMEPTCLRYSPVSGEWTDREPMDHPRGIGRAVCLDSLAWVLGGCEQFGTGLNIVEVYDPRADTWGDGPSLPENAHDFASVVWRDSLVYVIGGGNWAPGSPPSDRVWVLDPARRAWDSVTPLPEPRGALSAEVLGDTIIVACGWTDSGPTNRTWLGVINESLPTAITWQPGDTLPAAPRSRALSASVNGRVCLAGGILGSGEVTDETWQYDPGTDAWTRLANLPAPVTDAYGAAGIGNWLHVAGGFPGTLPYSREHHRLYRGRYDTDVGVCMVVSPLGRVAPGVPGPVAAEVRNHGTFTDNASVRIAITDTLSGQKVFEADTSVLLGPGDPVNIVFGQYAPEAGRVFGTRCSIAVFGDENPENDTATSRARTTPMSDPDGYGYLYETTQEPDTIRFSWLAPVSPDTIDDWEPDPDNGLSERELPFPFPFYRDTLDDILVSTDGYLQTTEELSGLNRPFPFARMLNVIAPFWDDLNLRSAGAVTQSHHGNVASFTWQEVPRYEAPEDRLTFQVLLYRDGRVRYNYLSLDGIRTSSSIGTQGLDGSWDWFLQYVHDAEPNNHIPHDSVSVVFYPPGAGVAEQPGVPGPLPARLLCAPFHRAGGPLEVRVVGHLPGRPRVSVYSTDGRLLRSLRLNAERRTTWDLRDRDGRAVATGAYFLHLAAPGVSISARTAILVR